jgi:hypothetical protein
MENVCIYDGRLIKSSLLLLQTGSCNFHTTLIALPRAVIHRARANSVSHKLRDLRGIKQTGVEGAAAQISEATRDDHHLTNPSVM